MSDEKENQGFRVIDKRRFNDEGDAKQESGPMGETTKANVNEKSTSASKPQTASGSSYAQQAGEERVEYASFLISLATQALALLGEIPNPETNQLSVNVEAAKQTIDILGMLEEKTKGNLSPDEERLQTEVLSSLRMAFVNKVRK